VSIQETCNKQKQSLIYGMFVCVINKNVLRHTSSSSYDSG